MCYLQCWKETWGDGILSVPMQRKRIDPRQGLVQSPHQMMYSKGLCVSVSAVLVGGSVCRVFKCETKENSEKSNVKSLSFVGLRFCSGLLVP